MEVQEFTYWEVSTEQQANIIFQTGLTCEILKITKNPTTFSAFILFRNLMKKLPLLFNLINLEFEIDEPLVVSDLKDILNLAFSKKILLTFESSVNEESYMIWKLKGENNKFCSLKIDNDAIKLKKFIWDFLIISLKNDWSGILPKVDESLRKLKIQSLGSTAGHNLLMLAVDGNHKMIVETLIQLKVFNISEKNDDLAAIDLAWKISSYDLVLLLLKSNSIFPLNFDILKIPKSHQLFKFAKICGRLHFLIASHNLPIKSNIEEISLILDHNKSVRYFYSSSNVSASFIALKLRKFDIFELLSAKNLIIAQSDPAEEILKILLEFNEMKSKIIGGIYNIEAKKISESYLTKIILNSFVGTRDEENQKRLIHIVNAIKFLNELKEMQPLLELVSKVEKFEFFFDFNRDTSDPTLDFYFNEKLFKTGLIYVAAKSFLIPDRKFEAFGVLAHEICHYAMYLAFENNAKPYVEEDSSVFQEVFEQCLKNSAIENNVKKVFDYDVLQQHAELIVRVPQILVNYFHNKNYVSVFKQGFSKLFDFFENIVLPKITLKLRNDLPQLKNLEQFSEEDELNNKFKKLEFNH